MTAKMQTVLEKQRAAFTAAMPESMAVRRDRIDRAIAMLIDHAEDFAKAVSADFGHRSHEQTLLTDIMPSVSAIAAPEEDPPGTRAISRSHTFFGVP